MMSFPCMVRRNRPPPHGCLAVYGQSSMKCVIWQLVAILFLVTVGMAPGREIFLTTDAETVEQDQMVGSTFRTMVTFNLGEVQINLPRTANWVENPMLLRPQLLLLRCGPLSSPSMVHVELLANQPRASGSGLYVSLIDPAEIAGAYQQNPGVTLTKQSLVPRLTLASFQKNPADGASARAADQPREEIHILRAGELGLRLRMVLSPQLDFRNETAIRRSLSRLSVRSQTLDGKLEERLASAGENPSTEVTAPSTVRSPTPPAAEETPLSPSSELPTAPPVAAKAGSETATPSNTISSSAANPSQPSLLLTFGTRVKKPMCPDGNGFTTHLAFDYGGVTVTLPKVANWIENAAVRRPQLLLLRHMGNVSTPSCLVLELVGRNVVQQANGALVYPEDPQKIVQQYQGAGWDILTGMTVDPKLLLGAYRRTASTESNPTEREEVYLLQVSGVGLRVRLVLAPGLPAKEETALRTALGRLAVQISSQPSASSQPSNRSR